MSSSSTPSQFDFAINGLKSSLRDTITLFATTVNKKYPQVIQSEVYNLWNSSSNCQIDFTAPVVIQPSASVPKPKPTGDHGCQAILSRGDRKDQPCGITVSTKSSTGKYCSRHITSHE